MPPDLVTLANLGLAGIGLYLFITGQLLSRKTVDAVMAALREGYDQRLAEVRKDRDEWRKLALGTERRLDQALPTIATAIGAPVPSSPPARGD